MNVQSFLCGNTGIHKSIFRYFILLSLFWGASGDAQHTKRDIAVQFAYGGQIPVVTAEGNVQGFYKVPIILNLRYQVATDYLNALSMTIEHISEERTRAGLWNDVPGSNSKDYNANISERLYITTLGLEGILTLFSDGRFRIGAGLGVAYGLGGAIATIENIAADKTKVFESCDTWNGFEVSAFTRARYTLYRNDDIVVGLSATLRIWGFPYIGPLSDCQSSYNGPTFRSLIEFGYLAGISVGF
jgi:hypothetical protein